jgi:beta-lactam-binding protein with PASTA domain
MGRTFLILLFVYLGNLFLSCLAYGNIRDKLESQNAVQVSVVANLKKPVGYENSPGEVVYVGVSGLDAIIVPGLIGRSADSVAMDRFLKGSGFSIRIEHYASHHAIPEGSIISQIPGALREVKSKGPIRVVVSTGRDEQCADMLNSDEKLRSTYQKPNVDVRTVCSEVRKSKAATDKK